MGCLRKTKSGEKEKDLSKRFCHLHMPERVEKGLALMNEARILAARSKTHGDAPWCRKRGEILSQGLCPQSTRKRCTIPLDIDRLPNARQLCFIKQIRLEYSFVPVLRWAYHWFPSSDKCRYLPHIKWNKRRVPFIFGTSRAPF
jgi:hypothetical protein